MSIDLKKIKEREETTIKNDEMLESLYYGAATEKNYLNILNYARQSAESDNPVSQRILGLMYYKGEGIEPDRDFGIYWLKRSADHEDEKAIEYLIQEAKRNIADYDEKIDFLQSFSERMSKDYDEALSDKYSGEKYIRYYAELEKFIPVNTLDIGNFITFCTEGVPECLYKNGFISPEYYAGEIRHYIEHKEKENPEEAKKYMEILKDYNFTMIGLKEFVSYLENEQYKGILTEETNWAQAERLVDKILRDKGFDIPNKDLGVLSASVAMGVDAFIVYSYSLTAAQILKKIQDQVNYFRWGNNGYRCELNRTRVLINGISCLWSYGLIENDKAHFAAVVFYLIPSRGNESESEWNMMCSYMTAFQLYMERNFSIDDGAIERITIPPHKEPFDNNGFSFIHSEVEEAFYGSEGLIDPYVSIIHNSQANIPSWYKTGNPSSIWPNNNNNRGNNSNNSNSKRSIGKYFIYAGIALLVLIIGINIIGNNSSPSVMYDDTEENADVSEDYYDEEVFSDTEEYPDNGNDPYYVKGNQYEVQENLRVREGPGKNYRILNRSELTSGDYALSVDSDTTTDALIEKGKYVKCLGMEGDWMRIESGWVCTFDEGEVLVR